MLFIVQLTQMDKLFNEVAIKVEGLDDAHNGVSIVNITNIFATQAELVVTANILQSME